MKLPVKPALHISKNSLFRRKGNEGPLLKHKQEKNTLSLHNDIANDSCLIHLLYSF